ncbi:PHD finger protein rhinoceros-like [Sycon ciliatum]|uniref:PHD finger protein rhinoceros-like n=1 Tax=Sycon ciliatum TaxID=27933 RepID=UPI0031F606F0
MSWHQSQTRSAAAAPYRSSQARASATAAAYATWSLGGEKRAGSAPSTRHSADNARDVRQARRGDQAPAPTVAFDYASALRKGGARSTGAATSQHSSSTTNSSSASQDRRHGVSPPPPLSSASAAARERPMTKDSAPGREDRRHHASKSPKPSRAEKRDDGFEEFTSKKKKKRAPGTAEGISETRPAGKASGKPKQRQTQAKPKTTSAPAKAGAAAAAATGAMVKPKFGKAATLDLFDFVAKPSAPPVAGSVKVAQRQSRAVPVSSTPAAGHAAVKPSPSVWPSLAPAAPVWPAVPGIASTGAQKTPAPPPPAAATTAATVATTSAASSQKAPSASTSAHATAAQAQASQRQKHQQQASVPRNVLDSTAPLVRRGKEREGGRKKKPTALKRTILQERESRRQAREAAAPSNSAGTADAKSPEDDNATDDEHDDDCVADAMDAAESEHTYSIGAGDDDIDSGRAHQDVLLTNGDSLDAASATAESPAVALSLCSGDGAPCSAADAAAAADDTAEDSASVCVDTLTTAVSAASVDDAGDVTDDVAAMVLDDDEEHVDDTPNNNADGCMPKAGVLHSRRFREYCDHMLEASIDEVVILLLQRIIFFQDRAHRDNPLKAKYRRRYVIGLREVKKHVKARKLKCVLISPNLERSKNPGGLDDQVTEILQHCQEQEVPAVFALNRRKLGRTMHRKTPASVVGLFNYDGAQDHFHELMSRVRVARDRYVAALDSAAAPMPADKSSTATAAAGGAAGDVSSVTP